MHLTCRRYFLPVGLSRDQKETADVTKELSRNRQRRNVTLGSRRTSVSLEEQVWDGLTEICRREEVGLDELCTAVEIRRVDSSMSSALRVFLLTYFRHAAELLEMPQRSQPSLGQAPQAAFPGLLEATMDRFHAEQKSAAGKT
nr:MULTISPECIES: ribbon-helix-helix domain-containing protein [Thalassobaculum]